MDSRHVSEGDIVGVLSAPDMTWHDPEEYSMVVSGRTTSGAVLVVYVHGNAWPVSGTIVVKSTAWRDS
jgi:hypothetical protein